MLYILFSHVLTLSQMFTTMFKPREIHNVIQGNGPFHWVTCQWHHSPLLLLVSREARETPGDTSESEEGIQ